MTKRDVIQEAENLEMEADQFDVLPRGTDKTRALRVKKFHAQLMLVSTSAQAIAKSPKTGEDTAAVLGLVVVLAQGLCDLASDVLLKKRTK